MRTELLALLEELSDDEANEVLSWFNEKYRDDPDDGWKYCLDCNKWGPCKHTNQIKNKD